MTPAEFVTEARTWIGTKWVHGQAVKGAGTDCVGFIIALGKRAGWIPDDYKPPVYSSQWMLHRDTSLLTAELEKFCDPVGKDAIIEAGDIIQFTFGRTPGHAGIYTGAYTVINADIKKRKVAEVPLAELIRNLANVWRPRWADR